MKQKKSIKDLNPFWLRVANIDEAKDKHKKFMKVVRISAIVLICTGVLFGAVYLILQHFLERDVRFDHFSAVHSRAHNINAAHNNVSLNRVDPNNSATWTITFSRVVENTLEHRTHAFTENAAVDFGNLVIVMNQNMYALDYLYVYFTAITVNRFEERDLAPLYEEYKRQTDRLNAPHLEIFNMQAGGNFTGDNLGTVLQANYLPVFIAQQQALLRFNQEMFRLLEARGITHATYLSLLFRAGNAMVETALVAFMPNSTDSVQYRVLIRNTSQTTERLVDVAGSVTSSRRWDGGRVGRPGGWNATTRMFAYRAGNLSTPYTDGAVTPNPQHFSANTRVARTVQVVENFEHRVRQIPSSPNQNQRAEHLAGIYTVPLNNLNHVVHFWSNTMPA